jgi:hypothetical protein
MAMQLNNGTHSSALNGEASAWLSDPPAARPSYRFGGHCPAALESLQSKEQWLTWDYVWNADKGRYDKPPCSAHTGRPASINNSANLGTFAEAAATAARLKMAGVGFLLTNDDGMTGIDIDHCITDSGSLSDLAAEVIGYGETYAEVSPSGAGIRLFARGKIDKAMKDDALGVEIYGSGRYLTVTGQQIPDTPNRIADAPRTLGRLVAAIDAAREAKRRKSNRNSDTDGARTSDFFDHVNVVALTRLDEWVPRVLPKAVKHATGAWRVTSRDLVRDYEEDLSIHPAGIQDFGPETGLSPVDVVLKYGTAADAAEAALWLCETLAIDPIALGWKGTKKHVYRPSDQQEEREIGRLAALGTFEYERVREAEAQRLNVRVSVLDGQVAKRRKADEQAAKPGFLKPPTPWLTPVKGDDLLTSLEQALARHVKLNEHACSATALWVVHCHAIDCAEIAPVLAIESPEKRCGKTTLLSVIDRSKYVVSRGVPRRRGISADAHR